MNIEVPKIIPQAVTLDPAKSLIVIVDMENDFCTQGGAKYLGAQSADSLRSVRKMTDRARPLRVPVIYVQSLRNEKSPEITVYGRARYVMEGTWGSDICQEITPQPGDPVVPKYTHDCFHETTMDSLLKRIGAQPLTHHVIVCGVATGTCVYHAVLGFHIRHYRTYIPIDCTTAKNEKEKMLALTLLNRTAYNYNVTITSSDIIEFKQR